MNSKHKKFIHTNDVHKGWLEQTFDATKLWTKKH